MLIEAIKRACEDRKLTQKELAELAGLTPSTVSRLLSGKAKGSVEQIEKLLGALRLEVKPSERASLIENDFDRYDLARTLYTSSDCPVPVIAARLGLPVSTVYGWVRWMPRPSGRRERRR